MESVWDFTRYWQFSCSRRNPPPPPAPLIKERRGERRVMRYKKRYGLNW